MGFRLFLFCILLSIPLFLPAEPPRELIRIDLPDREQIEPLIERSFDLWVVDRRTVTAYVLPGEKLWLDMNGYTYTSEQHVVEALLRDRRAVDGFFTLAEYEAAMNSWVVNNPSIAALSSLGMTAEGRNIWLLKISDNVATDEDEPAVLMISLQHAREWLAGMTLHGITNHLITGYGNDPRVTNLVDNLEIYVVLVANPDGYSYTHTNDRLWRKNRRNNGNGTFGVDTNRNFPFQWTLTSPTSSSTYGGPSPLSELESVALNSFLLSRNPVGLLNYHTYGTRVMHNWAYTFSLPPNAEYMGDLVYDMAQAIEAVNGQSFRNGSWAIALDYTGGGETCDYTHATLGIPGLTLELRPVSEDPAGFVPPGSSIVPSVSENIPGALHFLEWALDRASDVTAPSISDLEVYNISSTEVSVRWKTDDASTRQVDYGATLAYGQIAQPDKLRDVNHSVRITGLTPSTEYHAQVASENLAGLTGVSEDFTFMTAASPQDITPPNYTAITIIRRASPTTMEVRWENLDAGPLGGFRLYESSNEGETWTRIYDETTLTGGMLSATLPAPPSNQMRWYYITAIDNSPNKNESIPSDTYALRVGPAPSSVLVIDGFDRWNSMRFSNGGKNHRFAAMHGSAIDAFGLGFDTCANQAIGNGLSLLDYQTLVWVLGEETTGTETFSTAEQTAVKAFLESGRNLFVTGSEIGYDLEAQGSTADRTFYQTYLGGDYLGDDFNKFAVQGVPSTIFDGMQIKFDDGSRRIYRVDFPDRITAINGSAVALRTTASEGAAVQRQSPTYGRIVMLSFPFETIYPAEARNSVMAAALGFFGLSSTGVHGWMLME